MPSDRGRDAVEPEEAPPAPLTAPGDLPAGGKSAEDILASIFSPVPEASPLEQLEQTLRHPKKLIYIAMSNRNFYWRMRFSKTVPAEGSGPIHPFFEFDHYVLLPVPKPPVREAINNPLSRFTKALVFS